MNSTVKKIAVFIFALIMIANTAAETTYAASSKYGFTYDTAVSNVEWKASESILVKTAVGDLLGTMTYYVGVARAKGTNDYVLMTKEVMTPYGKKAQTAFLKWGYGFSEYVSVSVVLPSLDNYMPTNSPTTDSVTLNASFSEKGAQVGASYTVKKEQLAITAKCDTPNHKYYIVYDYKPYSINILKKNTYLANESSQMGMAEFTTSENKVTFTINYDARFGANNTSDQWAYQTQPGYVRSKTGSRKYSFTIKKN